MFAIVAMLLGSAAALPAKAQTAGDAPTQCPDNYVAYKNEPAPLTCTCPGDATSRGSVWGSDTYTGDSSVCRAALHAGVVGKAGGQVSVQTSPGRSFYPGSTRNGLSSNNYGRYESSFQFTGLATAASGPSQCPDNFSVFKDTTEPLDCTCPADAMGRGSVWGTNIYTGDSSVCRAALHMGAVGRNGGQVTVVPMPGRSSYPGTTRNGLSSNNYGQYASSFQVAAAGSATPGGATPAGATPAGATQAGAAPAVTQCPDNFVAYKDEPEPLACTCPADATGRGSVWGTDTYTGDSSVCRAALHAGAIPRAGGQVIVQSQPGRNAYPGTTRNGLASNNYGRYDSSFRFAAAPGAATPAAPVPDGKPQAAVAAAAPQQCPDNFVAYKDEPEPLACTCPADATARGSVWGTDVYTADSGVCRAALHAGIVGRTGGPVVVQSQPGRNAYPGTTRNGLSSSNFGTYDASFRFAAGQRPAATPAPAATPMPVATGPQQCPDNFVAYKDETAPLTCTCPADATQRGSLWGTDVYTADSAVCRAALHAGVIGRLGGTVTLSAEPGRRAYPGTTRNGLSSNNFGQYDASYRFAPGQRSTLQEPVQAAIAASLQSRGQVDLYIHFRTGSADLDMSSAVVLMELLAVLRNDPGLRLQLTGHTDNTGTRATNQPLSIRRGEAVRTWLVGQGISASRLAADGKGQDAPIAPNTTPDGQALNRRVQAVRAS